MIHRVEREIAGRTLSIETGELAQQAGGSVTIQYGDTVILATATITHQQRDIQQQERMMEHFTLMFLSWFCSPIMSVCKSTL